MALKAAKTIPARRVIVLFQPHRYTRTRDLFEEFMTTFYDADMLVLTEIYAAGEPRIAGISSEHLFEGLKKYGHKDVCFMPDLKSAEKHLLQQLKPGDIFLTLGAGDVWQAGQKIMERIKPSKKT